MIVLCSVSTHGCANIWLFSVFVGEMWIFYVFRIALEFLIKNNVFVLNIRVQLILYNIVKYWVADIYTTSTFIFLDSKKTLCHIFSELSCVLAHLLTLPSTFWLFTVSKLMHTSECVCSFEKMWDQDCRQYNLDVVTSDNARHRYYVSHK